MKLTLDKHWPEVREAHAKWNKARHKTAYATKWNKAYAKWDEAVRRTCGPNASIEWTDEGCMVLGVMLFLY